MDARGDRELICTIQAGPITVLGNLAVENGVSINTARSHLRELNKFPRHCRNKPILTPSNIAARLCWIEDTIHTDFQTVMFTDETAFRVGEGGRKLCIRGPGEAYLPQHINPKFRRGLTLRVWGAIYHGYKLPLVRFDLAKARMEGGKKIAAQTITADVYVRQILEGPLVYFVRRI